jgi:hypothetical protein
MAFTTCPLRYHLIPEANTPYPEGAAEPPPFQPTLPITTLDYHLTDNSLRLKELPNLNPFPS